MRISDWSSDVGSSDLHRDRRRRIDHGQLEALLTQHLEIGGEPRDRGLRKRRIIGVALVPPIRERTLWIDIDQDHRPGAGQLSLHRQMPRTRGLAGPALLRCHCENPHQRPLKILLFQWLQIDRKSEEHTSELQSLIRISYAVFCLKKTTTTVHRLV